MLARALDDVDYSCIFREPSALEQVYAIYANVLEFDESGHIINAQYAARRAAQYILQYVTGRPAEPSFEVWEVELHEPPPARLEDRTRQVFAEARGAERHARLSQRLERLYGALELARLLEQGALERWIETHLEAVRRDIDAD